MIHRIDVRTTPLARGGAAAVDPVGEAVRHQVREFGTAVGPIETTRIFLIDADATADQVSAAADALLADPVIESAEAVTGGAADCRIEIHLKPGVMDPVAASTETALRDLGLEVRQVRTGRAYVLAEPIGRDELRRIASRVLANGVIESVHFDRYVPERFETGRVEPFQLRHVALRELTDEQLKRLSRDGHLFLSLDEMRAVQTYFRQAGREPTDVELETVAQTWSEHCVHKTLKSAVDVEERDASGQVLSTRRYANLIKETIFGSTVELMAKEDPADPFCLSVFKDNAGVIAFDGTDAVCFKAETHNHPSAIEPYGGSATGIGGCIRDVLGTGLGAKPIANTDVFCVAHPDGLAEGLEVGGQRSAGTKVGTSGPTSHLQPLTSLPKGVIHPKRVLQQVVAGVRDYGNRMGIPTVNGAVYFDDRYVGNPLVFCGCVGIIPRDKIDKGARAGDKIVVLGGRTGRDGIHGATFSSAELTDTHADEFSHAVQIGNAITEKKVADVILQARDAGLFTGVTDCGAGGLSSAIGEMGEKTGAAVDLGAVPLKYDGLRYDEIWISEAQERMVLSVPAERVDALLKLAAGEDVEATVIGTFGTPGRELVLSYAGTEIGRVGMHFLHDGIPMPTRKAVVVKSAEHGPEARVTGVVHDFAARLLKTLADPNVASKHWIIRQYDHEVQGGSVIKPLVGPLQIGPSDASVVRPKLGSHRGVAIGCGLVPSVVDPYDMAIAAIDEAVRNVVCVGADYSRIALLDNFCWPSVDDELTMGTLVRACEACRDAARAFGIPFISGKDSLHNQFTDHETGRVIRIPPTLLISAIAIVPDVRRCVTMDFKARGLPVYLVATRDPRDLSALAATHRKMAAWIAAGHVAACHDVSDGGYAVAAAEMAIASGIGVTLDPDLFARRDPFAKGAGQYVIQASAPGGDAVAAHFGDGVEVLRLGMTQQAPQLLLFNRRMGQSREKAETMMPIDQMTAAWRGTLDW